MWNLREWRKDDAGNVVSEDFENVRLEISPWHCFIAHSKTGEQLSAILGEGAKFTWKDKRIEILHPERKQKWFLTPYPTALPASETDPLRSQQPAKNPET